MARFRVYRSADGGPLLLDLQTDTLDRLKTRVMAPLYPVSEMSWSMGRLNPRFRIGGELYVMATQRLAAVPLTEIGELMHDLSSRADDIVAATDFLFQGF